MGSIKYQKKYHKSLISEYIRGNFKVAIKVNLMALELLESFNMQTQEYG